MPLTKPIKLNPTTITIPQSSSTCSPYPLKLALTPHLLTEDSLNLPPIIKKEGDAVFEVMVPVGGSIEVEIEVDRDGLEKVGGADMSISEEIELEEVIKKNIVSAFRRNTTSLGIEEIRLHGNETTYTIRPLASNADRSHSISALVPAHQPIVHLAKLGISLNWCQPSSREKQEPYESQSSNPDSQPSSQPSRESVGDDEDQIVVQGTPPDGQLPVWADRQLQQALDQLLRTNLIKRFPLIFDPDLHRYIPSITKSATLLHTLTRVLALSASHRTDLYLSARPKLRSLLNEQDRITRYKQDQISSLERRNRSKRIKGDTESGEGSQDNSQSPGSITLESQMIGAVSTESKQINVKLLSDAITRIGWVEWKQRRAGRGKLNVRRIKLVTQDSDGTNNRLTESQGSELNKRMSGLHLDDGDRWGAFLDDNGEDFEIGTSHHIQNTEFDDDLFLASEVEDEHDDNDLFDDHDDDFFDSDDEGDQGRDKRMEGVHVDGYPWPEQMGYDQVDDWLDREGSTDAACDDDLLDFDHNDHLFNFDHGRQQDKQTAHSPVRPCTYGDSGGQFGDDGDDDDFFDDDEELFEDEPHMEHHPPAPVRHPDRLISSHQDNARSPLYPNSDLRYAHHTLEGDVSIDVDPELLDTMRDDQFLDDDDDDLFDDDDEDHSAYIPIPGSNELPDYRDRLNQLPGNPQFSHEPSDPTRQFIQDIKSNLPDGDRDGDADDLDHGEEDFFDGDQMTYHPPPLSHTPQVQHISPLIHLEPAQFILPRSPQFSLGQAGTMICDDDLFDLFESDDDLESEVGVYTADQHLTNDAESLTPSTLDSTRPSSPRSDLFDPIYRIPSLPSIDMVHYGGDPKGDEFVFDEDEEDAMSMSFGADGFSSRDGTGLDPTTFFLDFEDLEGQERGHVGSGAQDIRPSADTEMVELTGPLAPVLGSMTEEMGQYSEDDLF